MEGGTSWRPGGLSYASGRRASASLYVEELHGATSHWLHACLGEIRGQLPVADLHLPLMSPYSCWSSQQPLAQHQIPITQLSQAARPVQRVPCHPLLQLTVFLVCCFASVYRRCARAARQHTVAAGRCSVPEYLSSSLWLLAGGDWSVIRVSGLGAAALPNHLQVLLMCYGRCNDMQVGPTPSWSHTQLVLQRLLNRLEPQQCCLQ